MDKNIQSLSNQLYHIKHKLTDIEFYNLYNTLSLIAKKYEKPIVKKYIPPVVESETEEEEEYIEGSVASSISSSDSDFYY